MGAKREQVLWKGVWDICARLEKSYSLKAILSAGVLVLSKLTSDEREKAVADANTDKPVIMAGNTVRNTLHDLADAERAEPGVIVKILDKEDSAELRQLRDALGVIQKKRQKSS